MEPPTGGVWSQHLVRLSDQHGSVILQIDCTAEEAERVMAAGERAGIEADYECYSFHSRL